MSNYQAFYSPQHLRHSKNFPPQAYADLNREDITLLAPILAAGPPKESDSCASCEATTRQLIAELPSHLRSKIRWLTTFCSLHKKLNPLPIISLWNAIKRDADHELATTWSKVCLTPAQRHFVDRIRQRPWHTQNSNCAACRLSQLAHDNDILIALGATTLATLTSNNWKKSKRALFLQGLLQGRAGPGSAQGAVQKMLELGSQFRDLRKGLQKQGMQPPHVDKSNAMSTEPNRSPPRPPREPSQDDHLAVTIEGLRDGTELLDVRRGAPEPAPVDRAGMNRPAASSSRIARKPVPGSAKPNLFQHAFHQQETRQPSVAPDAASSIYSRQTASTASQVSALPAATNMTSTVSYADEGEILDLYRHSIFPKPCDVRAANANVEAQQKPLPAPRQKDAEHAKYPRHKLAPITIPRDHYGGEGALRTSVLWKRRAETDVPRLRRGKNGEVKGPFDSVSDVGLENGDAFGTNRWV